MDSAAAASTVRALPARIWSAGQHDRLIPEPHILLIVVSRHPGGTPARAALPLLSLPESRRHHATEDYLVDSALGDACVGQRRRGSRAAELGRLQVRTRPGTRRWAYAGLR